MNAVEALAKLRGLKVPVVETADAAAALRQSVHAASKTLARLAKAQLVISVRHGVWWIDGDPDAYRLSEYLSAPFPSYLSLQTALHVHGMIEQIPRVHYAVTLARTQTIRTHVGTYSFHHIDPTLFGGFIRSASGAPIATPEKALFDLAYLSAGRSRLFADLPEIELPRRFGRAELKRWISRIASPKRRTFVHSRLARFVEL
jgi:predicted transcriptional regulator of viral defense system